MSTPEAQPLPRVVIVDDEQQVLRALTRELRQCPIELTAFTDPREALEEIRKGSIALVITDNRMPGMTGIELLEHVKRAAPDTSRIILTGYTDLDSAIRAINEGEVNYFVTKPWEHDNLLECVNQGLEKYRLRAQIRQAATDLESQNRLLSLSNEELKDLATRDRMTRLYNRAEFDSALARHVKMFRRDGRPFCLALGDIDNFKRVNDTHGHPVGDEVIKTVAETLLTALRDEMDASYRYGGEEFAVLMQNTAEAQGDLVMSRILERIAATSVPTGGDPLRCTMSFGVGEFCTESTGDAFLKAVDGALYAAKRGGKNRVVRLSTLGEG